MLEQSAFSVISPEGAAAIVSRDARRAPEWADALRLAAADAYELGLIDGVVPGKEHGRRARAARVRRVRELVRSAFGQLDAYDARDLVAARQRRYLETTRELLRPQTGPATDAFDAELEVAQHREIDG